MSAHDDTELRSLLERLSDEIGPDGSQERSTETIINTLSELIDLAAITAHEATEIGMAAFLEV